MKKKFPKTMPFDWDDHQRFDPTLLSPDPANPNDRASDKTPSDAVKNSRPTGAQSNGTDPVSPSRKNLGDIEKGRKENER